MNYRTKRFSLIIVIFAAIIIILAGCRDVDDTETSDSGELEVSIYGDESYERAGIGNILGVPKGVEVRLDTGSSALESLEIDDEEIEVPETDRMYVEYFTPATVDNYGKQNMAETLFDTEDGIYVYDYSNRVKSDVQSDIDYCEKLLEAAEENGDSEDITYYEYYLRQLYQELEDAGNGREAAGDYSADAFLGTMDDLQYILRIYNGDEKTGFMGISFMLTLYSDELMIRPYSGALVAATNWGDYSLYEDENQSEMTVDEAELIARDFISEFGITDISLTETSVLIWEYMDSDDTVTNYEVDGYMFEFSKTINSVEIYKGNVDYADNLQVNDATFSVPVETYRITVYDGKVIGAYWTQISSSFNDEEAVELLSFDEILASVNENAGAYYEKYPTMYSRVEFNDVRLSYFAVSDDDKTYKYIPVWLFLQYDEISSSTDYGYEKDGALYPEQFMAVNAETGEIIDVIENAKNMGLYFEE